MNTVFILVFHILASSLAEPDPADTHVHVHLPKEAAKAESDSEAEPEPEPEDSKGIKHNMTRNQINDTFLSQNRVKVVGEVSEK